VVDAGPSGRAHWHVFGASGCRVLTVLAPSRTRAGRVPGSARVAETANFGRPDYRYPLIIDSQDWGPEWGQNHGDANARPDRRPHR